MSSKVKAVVTLGAIALLVTTFNLFSNPSQAENTTSPQSISNDIFEGKIVVVTVDRSSALESKSSSRSMTDAKVVEIGRRFYIIGTAYVPDDSNFEHYEYMQGVSIGIVWEEVSEFRAFTEEQFGVYMRILNERRED